jgi:hypothetical protein
MSSIGRCCITGLCDRPVTPSWFLTRCSGDAELVGVPGSKCAAWGAMGSAAELTRSREARGSMFSWLTGIARVPVELEGLASREMNCASGQPHVVWSC